MTSSTPEPAASSHGPGVVVPSVVAPSSAAGPSAAAHASVQSPEDAPLRTKLKRLGIALLPLLAVVLALWSGLASCPNRALTGVPCPGCGLTRATLALCSGHLVEALHWHPLVPLMLPLIAFLIVRSMLIGAGLIGPSAWQVRVPKWLFVAFGVLVLAVWLARLAGQLGGPSDPIDLSSSLVGRALTVLGVI